METPTVNSSKNQAQCDDSVKCVSLITQGPGYRELTCFAADEPFMFLSVVDSGCIHYSSVTADVSLLYLFVCFSPQSSHHMLPVFPLRWP